MTKQSARLVQSDFFILTYAVCKKKKPNFGLQHFQKLKVQQTLKPKQSLRQKLDLIVEKYEIIS